MAVKKKATKRASSGPTLKQARLKAKAMDESLLSTDKRLHGSVFMCHRDGSMFLFDSAFVGTWHAYAIILTEHHGAFAYELESLKHLRAMGPRSEVHTFR